MRVGLRHFAEDERHLDADDRRLRHPDLDGARSGGGDGGIREKKVVWVQYGSGAPGHYGYAHRDWNGPGWTTLHGRAVDQQPPDGETTTTVPYYGGRVSNEFAEAAVARHQQIYGAKPEPFLILEHEWPMLFASEPGRMRKSRTNFEQVMTKLPRGGALPRIDLKPSGAP